MDLDNIKRGLRAEIKKRENEQYLTFQCNVRQMCKDVLAKLEEQESEIAELEKKREYTIEHTAEVINAQEREIRHHKYKRCLAMAMWCRDVLRLMRTYEVTEDFWNLEPGQDAEYYCKKGDFYSKWRKHWLELAEKFKEAK